MKDFQKELQEKPSQGKEVLSLKEISMEKGMVNISVNIVQEHSNI